MRGAVAMAGIDFGEDWYKLPLKLRQRWWKETDYGREPPEDELRAEVLAELAKVRGDEKTDG